MKNNEMLTIQDDSKPDKDWNQRLLNIGFGPMVQTKERAVTYTKQGGSARFLKFLDKDNQGHGIHMPCELFVLLLH